VGTAAISLTVAIVLVVSQSGASAQLGPLLPPLLPTPPSTAPPPPSAGPNLPPPEATTTTTAVPLLLKVLQPPSTTTTAPAPPPAAPNQAIPVPNNGGGDGPIPAGAGVFPADLARQSRSVRRSAARTTRALADGVRQLTDMGVPADEAIRAVFGRFPVAGTANFSHDWWLPRFGPGWRLHLGTDIFASRGTPVRSPTDGVVRLADGGLGGVAAYIVQNDGTYFYLAHLNNRVAGLKDGQAVRTGDVVGFVGSSGNASGGPTHLHFEVHPAPVKIVTTGKGKNRVATAVPVRVRPGTVLPAVDPKAYLDRALQDAVAGLPGVIAAFQANRPIPALGPVAAFPGALAAGGLPAQLASIVSAGPRARADTRFPLYLLALLLLLFVVVLTPVLAPRVPLAATTRRAVGPWPPAPGRRRRRTRAPAARPPTEDGAAPPPAPARPAARRRGRRRRTGTAEP